MKQTPSGPVLSIDMKDLAELMPTVLECVESALEEAGVQDALIGWPSNEGPLAGLPRTPRAVVLRLYPPPLVKYRWRSEPPRHWLAEACAWVTALSKAEDRLWGSVELTQFSLAVEEARAFFAAQQRNREAQYATLVAGNLDSRLRLCCWGSLWKRSSVESLILAGGGPAAKDEELLGLYEWLQSIARRLAPSVGHAHIAIEPGFAGFQGDLDSWITPVCDELVFDAFPYQVLGVGHRERLGGLPHRTQLLEGLASEVPPRAEGRPSP